MKHLDRRIAHQRPMSFAELIQHYIKEHASREQFENSRLTQAWKELMGSQIADQTESIELKKGVLYIRLKSAALRQQLFFARQKILLHLQNHFQDIRLEKIVLC